MDYYADKPSFHATSETQKLEEKYTEEVSI